MLHAPGCQHCQLSDDDMFGRVVSITMCVCVHRQDPKKRATANEILQHPWMKEHGSASSAPLDNVILRRMQGFSAMNKLKQQALYILAKNMAPAEVAGLRAIFMVRHVT